MNRILMPGALAFALLQAKAPALADDTPATPASAASAASSSPARLSMASCRPEYPEAARRAGPQGVTRVHLAFDATGQVIATDIVQSAGPTPEHHLLDAAAAAALATCKVTPGRDADGHAIGGDITVVYTWVIDLSTVFVPKGAGTVPWEEGSTRRKPLPNGWSSARIHPTQSCMPIYPKPAIQAKAQGTTRLSFDVDASGRMTGAWLAGSAGSTPEHQLLDSEAVRALSTCRFDAATNTHGEPRDTRLTVEYRWTL
jgi:TonB family protein